MKIQHNNKQYDLRYKKRYLPKELQELGGLDYIVLIDRNVNIKVKQKILGYYLPEAKIITAQLEDMR